MTLTRFNIDAERAARAERLATFHAAWERHFRADVAANPARYVNAGDADKLTRFVASMRVALQTGKYGKDSANFKAACKELGIKHTYKAINAYLDGL